MSDLISRQAAIDAASEGCFELRGVFQEIRDRIMQLPSAEPEIVQCKDCKWFHNSDGCFFSTAETIEDGFCSWAERRTDETN